jgi:hypothetical protein
LCTGSTCRLLGYPQRLLLGCFQPGAGLPRTDRPSILANRVEAPLSRLPFGVSSPVLPARPFRGRLSCRGFCPSSRHHRSASTSAGFPESLPCSALRLSQPLDGLLRATALRVYCAPQPRPGLITVQGILPIRSQTRLIAGPCPRAVTAQSLTGRNRLPRPNGSTSRRCSTDRSVPRGRWLAFPLVAPLFGFRPPSGSSALTVAPVPRVLRS